MSGDHLPDARPGWARPLLTLSALLLAASAATAGERRFTYTYEPQALPPGAIELEQWITSRIGKASGHFVAFDLRTEIEFGIIENLQTALYLNLEYEVVDDARTGPRSKVGPITDDGETSFTEFEFEGVSNEWVYKVTDPVADAVGLALYVEWGTNGEEFELEERIILGKVLGPLTLALNLFFEQEWELDENEEEGVFGAFLGISHQISDTGLAVGVELRTLHVLEDFDEYEHSIYSAGPVLHYTAGRWWAALTVLPQLGSSTPSHHQQDYEEFEAVEVRLLVGIDL